MKIFSNNKEQTILNYINKKSYKKRLIQFIIGVFFVALSYNIFIVPNHLIPGGVGGLAIIIHSLIPINNSLIIFILNIFLLLLSLKLLGIEKTRASLLGSIIFPTFVKLTENINVWLEIDTSHILLSAIFAGIIYGFGAGLVFKAGFTTGGTDIINQIISKYLKISLGQSMFLSDGLIVISSSIFFGINRMLYSIIILYSISLISDRVVLGISDSKAFFIITNEEESITKFILKQLGYGVTIFKAKGGYKTKNEHVLMCVLPTKDYYHLKEGIRTIDPDAFYIITDTYEVYGGKENGKE